MSRKAKYSPFATRAIQAVGVVILLVLGWSVWRSHRAGTLELVIDADGFGDQRADASSPAGDPARRGASVEIGARTGEDERVAAADWTVKVTPDATFVVSYQGAPIVTSSYVFWGPDWAWAEATIQARLMSEGRWSLQGAVSELGLRIAGRIEQTAPEVFQITYEIAAERDLAGITGGGVEWRLATQSPAFDSRPQLPTLLLSNKGWHWPLQLETFLRAESSDPLPETYFEQGARETVRTMLVGDRLSAGSHTRTITLTVPRGAQREPSPAERYGTADLSRWHRGALEWTASPVDLSHLNHKPAGQHGFVRAEGNALVFEDGTPARFWGGNVVAYTLFSDKEQIARQAKRIARLGYNLMRFHHHDSTGWVSPTVIDKRRDDTRELDAEAMDRVDYWIKCLRDEGVYVWLDLHVGRLVKPGDFDAEPGEAGGYDEIARADGEMKGFAYANDTLRDLMREFNEAYLTHVNPYTGFAYKDDPAIVGILITNENDLTSHFGNLMLPDKGNPWHQAQFDEAIAAFCERTELPRNRVWETWLPGPSKIFLNDQEVRFNRYLLEHLEGLGVRVPVATTNFWGVNRLYSLPALTVGGIIDVHSYGGAEALSANPRFTANYVSWLACAQVAGMPMAITEWNVPHPAEDRFTAPLYVAAIASLQGWDAPMIYAYSQQALGALDRMDKWSTFTDPALTGLMPTAALAYRRGDIQPARETYCLSLGRQETYYQEVSPETSAALRTLAEISRVTIGLPDIPELDWDRTIAPEEGSLVVTDLERDFIPAGQEYVESDTGEIRRDWEAGVQTINTARTQAAAGWLGDRRVRLGEMDIALTTPKATVAATSLDDAPLAASRRILVTAIARSEVAEGRLPFLSEPIAGEITLHAVPGLAVRPIGADGAPLEALDAPYEEGAYRLRLPAARGTHWFLFEASDAP